MARKVHAGVVGGSGLGGLSAIDTTLTAAEDSNITVDPSGTGVFEVDGNQVMLGTSEIRFADTDSSNYVAFKAAGTVGSNVTWTLPSADATAANQSLVSNGSGTLSFVTTGATITDNTSDSATNYLVITNSSSGTLTAARVSTTKLSFQPSTGTLTCTALTESSSIAYKENINPIENALDKILQLSGVIYDRRDRSRTREPGLIAEEVEKVIPNVITYKEGKAEGITYTKLTAYLIEAVKELRNAVKSLEESK